MISHLSITFYGTIVGILNVKKMCFWLHVIDGMMHVVWHQNSIDAKFAPKNAFAPDSGKAFDHITYVKDAWHRTQRTHNKWRTMELKKDVQISINDAVSVDLTWNGFILVYANTRLVQCTLSQSQTHIYGCTFIYVNRKPDTVRYSRNIHLWCSLFKCLFYSLALSFWHNFM